MASPKFRPLGFLFLLVVMISPGCGQAKSTVKGRVTYRGEPIQEGKISLLGDAGKQFDGPIHNGEYTVVGVPVARTYSVTAQSSHKRRKPPWLAKAPAAKDDPPETISLPSKYQNWSESGLKIEVSGKEVIYDIALTD
jgi:hypothetical protein